MSKEELEETFEEEDSGSPYQRIGRMKSRTPVLDVYCTDLTKLVENDRVILIENSNTEREVETLINFLSLMKNKNILLVGELENTAESLCHRLASTIVASKRKFPFFQYDRIVLLDYVSLCYRGSNISITRAIERFDAIISEVEKSRRVLLCVQNLNQILNDDSIVKQVFINLFFYNENIKIIFCSSNSFFDIASEKEKEFISQFYLIKTSPLTLESKKQRVMIFIQKLENYYSVILNTETIEFICSWYNSNFHKYNLQASIEELIDYICAYTRNNDVQIPDYLVSLENRIDELNKLKNTAVKSQQYPKAAGLRDEESKFIRQREFAKVEWEESLKEAKKEISTEGVLRAISFLINSPVINSTRNVDPER